MNNVFKGVVVLSKEKYKQLEQKQENTLYVTSTFIESVDLEKLKILSVRKANILPNENIAKENTLYLIPQVENSDIFNIYILISSRWELIGNTKINLTDYYTKDEIHNLLLDIKSLKKISELQNDIGYVTNNINKVLSVNPKLEDENSISIETNGLILSSSGLSITDKSGDNQAIIRIENDGTITIKHIDNVENSLVAKNEISINDNGIYHNKNKVMTDKECYTKEEVDAIINDLKAKLGLI